MAKIVITGHAVAPDSPADRLIRRWCDEAATALGYAGELHVVVWGDSFRAPADGIEATANASEIGFHVSLPFTELATHNELRFGFIVYEEVAHFVLHRAGLPDEGVGAFFQELYVTWVQYTHMVGSGRIPPSRLKTTPIPDTQPYYELGKHLGATLAGSEANRKHLDAWRNSSAADADKVALVEFAEAELTGGTLSVQRVIDAYERWTQR